MATASSTYSSISRSNLRQARIQKFGIIDNSTFQRKHVRHVRKVALGTKKQYANTKALLTEFLSDELEFSPDDIQAFFADQAPLVDRDLIKNFMRWHILGSKGHIVELPSLRTSRNIIHKVSTVIARETGNILPRAYIDDFHGFLESDEMKNLGLQDVDRQETFTRLNKEDTRDILNTFWTRIAGHTVFGRQALQIPFVILLLRNTVNRPGAILATSTYPNVGIQYKDISLYVDQKEGGENFLRAKFRFNHRKGEKDSREWTEMQLGEREDFEFPDYAMPLLLGMAFADAAFDGIATWEQLFAVRCFGKAIKPIPWTVEAREKYVLRRPGNEDRPLSYDTFCKALKCAALATGLVGRVTPYSIRRSGADELIKHVALNTAEKVMGHQSGGKVLRKHYQSRLIDADIEGIMTKGHQYPEMGIEKLTRVERGNRPPENLPATALAAIDDRMMSIPKDSKFYWSEKRRLLREAKEEFHKSWRTSHPLDIAATKQASNLIPDSVEMLGDLRDSSTIEKIIQYRTSTDYNYISNYVKSGVCSIRQDLQLMKSLANIARCGSARDVVFYPDEMPVEVYCERGQILLCPVCSTDLSQMHRRQVPIHIHTCIGLTHQKPGVGSMPEYCYRCSIWFGDEAEFQNHCQNHFLHLDYFCGLIIKGYTVIVSGRCPFCLSDPDPHLPWHLRLREFSDGKEFEKHLRSHISCLDITASYPCPHLLCPMDASFPLNDLLNHLHDSHSIEQAYKILRSMEQSQQQSHETKYRQTNYISDGVGTAVSKTTRLIEPHSPQMVTLTLNTRRVEPCSSRSEDVAIDQAPKQDSPASNQESPTDYSVFSTAIAFEAIQNNTASTQSCHPMTTRGQKRRIPDQLPSPIMVRRPERAGRGKRARID